MVWMLRQIRSGYVVKLSVGGAGRVGRSNDRPSMQVPNVAPSPQTGPFCHDNGFKKPGSDIRRDHPTVLAECSTPDFEALSNLTC